MQFYIEDSKQLSKALDWRQLTLKRSYLRVVAVVRKAAAAAVVTGPTTDRLPTGFDKPEKMEIKFW